MLEFHIKFIFDARISYHIHESKEKAELLTPMSTGIEN